MLKENSSTIGYYMYVPSMIHFDDLDFCECRSEEVTFLLTLSIVGSHNIP